MHASIDAGATSIDRSRPASVARAETAVHQHATSPASTSTAFPSLPLPSTHTLIRPPSSARRRTQRAAVAPRSVSVDVPARHHALRHLEKLVERGARRARPPRPMQNGATALGGIVAAVHVRTGAEHASRW